MWQLDVWVCLDWLFTLMLFLVVALLVKMHSTIQRKTLIMGDLPTYPGGLPLIGHAHLATKFTYPALIEEMVRTRKENKGTLGLWLGPKVIAYVANPNDIENILNRKDALNKGQLFTFFQAHSNGLLNTTTPKWHKSRKMASVPLAHKKMIESFYNVYQEQSHVLIDIFSKKEGSDYFDVYPYLSRCCQDITYESHFGVRLGVQSNTHLSAHHSIAQAIALVLERMMKVWLFPDFIYFRTEKGKAMQEYRKHNQNIAKEIVAKRRKILESTSSYVTEESFEKKFPKVLDVYLNKENGLTDEDIVHEIMDIQLAGFETMSLTQSWVLLMLAMHPQHQIKVHEELDRMFPDADIPLTLPVLAECSFLDRVTKEALRLYGLPVVIRQLTKDVPIENYTLPATCEVVVGMNMVHRDPRFWERPDQFYPDHFLPAAEEGRPKYAFLPFGGGPRKCPAYAYGYVVVKFIVATLLRKYKFTTTQKFDNLPLELFFMYKPVDGFLLKFESRQ